MLVLRRAGYLHGVFNNLVSRLGPEYSCGILVSQVPILMAVTADALKVTQNTANSGLIW